MPPSSPGSEEPPDDDPEEEPDDEPEEPPDEEPEPEPDPDEEPDDDPDDEPELARGGPPVLPSASFPGFSALLEQAPSAKAAASVRAPNTDRATMRASVDGAP